MSLMRCPIKVICEGYRWYVLRVEGSYEKKASLALHFYGTAGVIPHYELVKQLWVPEVTVKSLSRTGVKKERRTSMMPGYLFMEAILSYPLYEALRKPEFPHVFGWLQGWRSWPAAFPQDDIRRLAVLEAETPVPKPVQILFNVGDVVAVPSLGIQGIILELTSYGVTLSIELFKRRVPIKVGSDLLNELVQVD